MIAIPFWSYVQAALCLAVIVGVIAYIAWTLYSHYRRRPKELPEPQNDPAYPVRRDDDR